MNIFFTASDPSEAAQSLPDKHVVKMPVEAVQMLVSVMLRHNVNPGVITKAGTVHKGGYHNHPCTVWAGDTYQNAHWTWQWGLALCKEYTKRYGKTHFAEGQLRQLIKSLYLVPNGSLTAPAQAMPDECKDLNPITAYRNCIRLKIIEKPASFVWNRGTPAPAWIRLPARLDRGNL